LKYVEIDDVIEQAGLFEFQFGRGQEITADTITQAGRFADVDHPAFVIFHQIDAGRFGQRFGLLRELGESILHVMSNCSGLFLSSLGR